MSSSPKRYENLGSVPVASTYNNTSDRWLVITGASTGTNSIGPFNANTASVILQIKDAQGAIFDEWVVIGSTYVANPTTGGSVYQLCLPRKMMVPPGGSVLSPSANIGNIQIMQCNPTPDGKDSLENALAIST